MAKYSISDLRRGGLLFAMTTNFDFSLQGFPGLTSDETLKIYFDKQCSQGNCLEDRQLLQAVLEALNL